MQAFYDQISQIKNFEQSWEGMTIVGALANFVLYFIAGDVLEIGVGESSIYLTAAAKRYNKEIYYCDIDKSKIDKIKEVPGWFSEKGHIFACSSNEMFAKNELTPLAFTFIDGNHEYEQAKKDFWNVEKLTVPNGYILIHDTYPPLPNPDPWYGNGSCGEVYKLRQELEHDERFDCLTFIGREYYIASTLIRKRPFNRPFYQI